MKLAPRRNFFETTLDSAYTVYSMTSLFYIQDLVMWLDFICQIATASLSPFNINIELSFGKLQIYTWTSGTQIYIPDGIVIHRAGV